MAEFEAPTRYVIYLANQSIEFLALFNGEVVILNESGFKIQGTTYSRNGEILEIVEIQSDNDEFYKRCNYWRAVFDVMNS